MSIDELAAKYANMSDILMDVDEETEGKLYNRSFKKFFINVIYIIFVWSLDQAFFICSLLMSLNCFTLQKHLYSIAFKLKRLKKKTFVN